MMGKVEKFTKLLEQQKAATAAKLGTPPAPAPRGPDRFDGMTKDKAGQPHMLLANLVADPDQPRKEFDADELDRLTESVRTYGVLQPIRAVWNPDLGKWVVRVGERRFRAALAAGLDKIPCVFLDGDARRRQEQLIENCLRVDLKPLERAQAFRDLMEEQRWTQQQLAAEIHVSQASISKSLRLLELPPQIQAEVRAGNMPPDVAIEIGKIRDPGEQDVIHREYSAEGMSRDKVAKKAKQKKGRGRKRKPAPKLFDKATFQVEDCVWKFLAPGTVTDEDLYRSYKLLGEQIGANRQGSAAA